MDQELFRMNAHGDIWQEPSLFDQGGDVPAPPPAATWCGECGPIGPDMPHQPDCHRGDR